MSDAPATFPTNSNGNAVLPWNGPVNLFDALIAQPLSYAISKKKGVQSNCGSPALSMSTRPDIRELGLRRELLEDFTERIKSVFERI